MNCPAPIAKLGDSLDRLALELSTVSELEGTTAEYFQSRMLPILLTLADVVKAARAAVEPEMANEALRANSASGGAD